MSKYSSGSINFAGLGNGTDFNAIIDGMVKVEKMRIGRLEKWKSSWENKNKQFNELNTSLLNLKSSLEKFDSMREFLKKSVTSTDTGRLTVTASDKAQKASHTVEIGQLASTDIHITKSGTSSLWSSITNAKTSFSFSYGGESITISNISKGTTLQGFVNLINNHTSSRNKIRASTIFDGSVYHLQLSGLDQGSKNQLTISNAGALNFAASDFKETQDAKNAQIRVNGYPPVTEGWIERDSNVINDAIEGLTLNLKYAEAGSKIKVNVTTDKAAIRENVKTFVDEINKIRTQIQAMTKVDDEGKGSILTGNYGIDIVSQQLKNVSADIGAGFVNFDPKTLLGDKYASLSQIGILTDAENGSQTYGLLKLDEEKFDKALRDNPDAVAKLFSADSIGTSQSTDFTCTSLIKGTTKPGVYDVKIVSDGSKITSATINGVEAKVSQWGITGLGKDAIGLGLRLDNTDAGTYTGTVSVKQGKTGEMIQELKDLTVPFNKHTYEGGPLAILQNNYKDIMNNIDKKIAFENRRIDNMKKTLKEKFSRLDALLGQYQLRQGQLANSIGQLGNK